MLFLYLHFWRVSLLAMLQYRLNLFIWMIFGVAYHTAGIGLLWGMLQRLGPSAGGVFPSCSFCTRCGPWDTGFMPPYSARWDRSRGMCGTEHLTAS